jgi:transmembrane sensor
MERANKIEQEAADWLARRDSASWSDNDQQAFDNWLQSSSINRGEYLRMEHVWEESLRLKALGAGLTSNRPPPAGRWIFSSLMRPRPQLPGRISSIRFRVAAAAAILLIAAGAYMSAVGIYEPGRYSTPVGKVMRIAIADGSHVILNTDSLIRVSLTATARAVELQRGEAFFEVAKDPSRPFVVTVGSQRVIAVGTQFSVRREGSDAEIVVTEGKVRVEAGGGGSTIPPESLPAGSVAHAGQSGMLVNTEAVTLTEERLSWRSGVLIFHESTLAEAALKFNRYTSHKIVIKDSKVAEMRISGTFKANNSEAFVRLLEHGYPVHAEVTGGETVLEVR